MKMNSFSPSPPSIHEQYQSSTFTTSHERTTSNHLHHYHLAPNCTFYLVFHHCLLTVLPDSVMAIILPLLHPASRTILLGFKKHVIPYIRALQCVMSSWQLTRLHLICSSGDLRVLTSHLSFLHSLPLLGQGPPCCCLCYIAVTSVVHLLISFSYLSVTPSARPFLVLHLNSTLPSPQRNTTLPVLPLLST